MFTERRTRSDQMPGRWKTTGALNPPTLALKPFRSRLEHGLGSTPSASTMRSKLIRMSSRLLIGRRLVRYQPDAQSSEL